MSKVTMKMNQILMAVMSRLTPSCDIITHKISESMDGKISLRDKLEIRIHLLGCNLCTRYRDQLLIIQDMLNKYTKDVEHEQILTDVSLSETARERIRRNLEQGKNK
ncbi:MAG: hypothetical protein GWP06_14435 [Actinobacteria bacterium]|nr:hypothetical protein [Actinomycetota bacterium]